MWFLHRYLGEWGNLGASPDLFNQASALSCFVAFMWVGKTALIFTHVVSRWAYDEALLDVSWMARKD